MWVGIDDTDSTHGMCTTYLAAKILRNLGVTATLRLVRLNPNIPYKTRGNGAVAFWTNDRSAKRTVLKFVKEYSHLKDTNTNPGVVFLDKEKVPHEVTEFYMKAVSELVTLGEAEKIASKVGAEIHKFKNGRGVIGALAAIGFAGDRTYELIAYREKKNWGRQRRVDKKSILSMDAKMYPRVFDNIGPKERILITPRGKDPILCGIRGTAMDAVETAWAMVKPLERVELVQVFETNQATDAHIRAKKINDARPYDCVMVDGTVTSKPKTIAGGHVVFTLSDGTGKIDCAAYRKTGSLKKVASKLATGDSLRVYGGIGKYENTINLEKIEIKSLREKEVFKRPICCWKNMTSLGKNKGYKCKKCGKKVSQKEVMVSHEFRPISAGLYDVSPGSRRHLSRPAFL